MRFYLDENFPILAADALQQLGHETFRAVDIHPHGAADKILFEDAQQRKAVFLTTDKDFFHTIPFLFPTRAASVVAITLKQANSHQIVARLKALLSAVDLEQNTDGVFLVTDTRILRRK